MNLQKLPKVADQERGEEIGEKMDDMSERETMCAFVWRIGKCLHDGFVEEEKEVRREWNRVHEFEIEVLGCEMDDVELDDEIAKVKMDGEMKMTHRERRCGMLQIKAERERIKCEARWWKLFVEERKKMEESKVEIETDGKSRGVEAAVESDGGIDVKVEHDGAKVVEMESSGINAEVEGEMRVAEHVQAECDDGDGDEEGCEKNRVFDAGEDVESGGIDVGCIEWRCGEEVTAMKCGKDEEEEKEVNRKSNDVTGKSTEYKRDDGVMSKDEICWLKDDECKEQWLDTNNGKTRLVWEKGRTMDCFRSEAERRRKMENRKWERLKDDWLSSSVKFEMTGMTNHDCDKGKDRMTMGHTRSSMKDLCHTKSVDDDRPKHNHVCGGGADLRKKNGTRRHRFKGVNDIRYWAKIQKCSVNEIRGKGDGGDTDVERKTRDVTEKSMEYRRVQTKDEIQCWVEDDGCKKWESDKARLVWEKVRMMDCCVQAECERNGNKRTRERLKAECLSTNIEFDMTSVADHGVDRDKDRMTMEHGRMKDECYFKSGELDGREDYNVVAFGDQKIKIVTIVVFRFLRMTLNKFTYRLQVKRN